MLSSLLPLIFIFITYYYLQRRQWHSTPVLLPGESHEQRSLAGYNPWGYKESDMTEVAKHACVCVHAYTHTHTHTHTFRFFGEP